MLLYYITNRTQFSGAEEDRRRQLLLTIRQAAAAGVDYIQLRENDLSIRNLELLASEVLRVVRAEGTSRLLIHHRTDVALAVGADGVQLTSFDISASDARALAATSPTSTEHGGRFLIAASCHDAREIRLADAHGADFAVLSPIFEPLNASRNGIGLEELYLASQKDRTPNLRIEAGDTRRRFPVFAKGGIDLARATLCAEAGAAGVAGTRLFQQVADLTTVVRSIRSI